MTRFLVPASSFLCLTAAAAAQLLPGTITAGNASFGYNSFPSSPLQTGGAANLRVAGLAGPDHLQEVWWYYRLAGDARESAFHDGPAQGPRSSMYSGDVSLLAWEDVDHRGLSARLLTSVYSTGPTAGMAVQAMTLTNLGTLPVTIDLFAFVDLNECGLPANDALANPDGGRQILRSMGCPTTGECYVPDADRYQVAPATVLRGKFANHQIDNLTNSGLPLLGQDYSSAWQWQRVLAPGQRLTGRVVLAQDFRHSGCFAKAGAQAYGNAKPGTNGLPTWGTASRPLLGTQVHLRIENGLPGAFPIGLVGLAPTSVVLPGLGTLLVDPNAGLTTMMLSPFDASRTSDTPFPIPNDPTLGGLPLHWQAAFVDPLAAQGIAHTNGLALAVGGLGWFCDCTGWLPPAPATPCVPAMVVQTSNATALCWGGWQNWCFAFSPCTLTRDWRCNAAGTAWTLIATTSSGCP